MNTNTDTRIERILNSADRISAEASPFFYSKLRARMEAAQEETVLLVRRPAFAIAAFSFFVIMNIFMLINSKHENNNSTATPTIESFASDYNLNTWNN